MCRSAARAETLVVGVAQPIENTLVKNQTKILNFIDEAKRRGCQWIAFPENALYWPDISIDKPTRAEIGRRSCSSSMTRTWRRIIADFS